MTETWQRVQKPQGYRLKPSLPPELRFVDPVRSYLTARAFEQLGRPDAIAFEHDATGRYSVVAVAKEAPEAIRVHPGHRLSTGALKPALGGLAFPLVISLEPNGSDERRLLFGKVRSRSGGTQESTGERE